MNDCFKMAVIWDVTPFSLVDGLPVKMKAVIVIIMREWKLSLHECEDYSALKCDTV
jgi:hypothetical protein